MDDKADTRLLNPRSKRNESQVPETQSKDSRPNQAHAPDTGLADWPVIDQDFYVVSREHARGGIGRILEATDQRLDRTVALKELLSDCGQEEARARFVREALVTARLQHPGIVPVYEAARWPNGKPFYAMKMVTGQSLAELLNRKKSFEERLALIPNMIAVAEAMAYARNNSRHR